MVFTARWVQVTCLSGEKQLDHKQCLNSLMITFFYTVNRQVLWSILWKLWLFRSLHDNMKALVCVNGELLDRMSVKTGVKQGDLLAPILFAIFICSRSIQNLC